VLERRVGFATARRAAADVVLQRQSAWTQIAQSGNLALDGLDAFFRNWDRLAMARSF
jgi:hypothetical protein